MSRLPRRVVLACLLATAATSALAGTVYQWKDARGVTHYSDAPPPKGDYRDRELGNDAQVAPADPTKATPADTAECAQYRLNLGRLRGSGEVGLDSNRDGKPDAPLSAEARVRQAELVEATIKAGCPGAG